MKKLIISIVTLTLLLSACNSNNENKPDNSTDNSNAVPVMENIDLTFSDIKFTKAINGAGNHYNVSDNELEVDGITGTNYFISPDEGRNEATAPILLSEIDNSKPFTFTTRIESKIEKIYDAGTVYIYIDNNNWLKFAFECDEKFRHRVVTVRTENSSDDNNHDIISQDYVYLRISSNTKQIGFYYSTDGEDWNLARIYRNEYPAKIWLGISSQSPKEGNNLACFRDMSLTESYISNHRLGN